MPDLATNYLGLTLKNPLVPSSTPLSHNLDPVLHLEDAGAAAIVMHSLFEEDVRNDELMIDRFLVNPDSFGEAAGHVPFGHDYQSKLDGYLEQIQTLKSRLAIPVVASLNGSSLTGWVELGKEMQDAGADGDGARHAPAEFGDQPGHDDGQAGGRTAHLQGRAAEGAGDDATDDGGDDAGQDRRVGGDGDTERQWQRHQEHDEGRRQVVAQYAAQSLCRRGGF